MAECTTQWFLGAPRKYYYSSVYSFDYDEVYIDIGTRRTMRPNGMSCCLCRIDNIESNELKPIHIITGASGRPKRDDLAPLLYGIV